MAIEPLPNVICPACGGPNACAPALAGSFAVRCWCERVSFEASVLERLPAEERGRACLCAKCAVNPIGGER